MLATKVGNSIGSERAATIWLSITRTRTKTSLCASNTTPTTPRRRKVLLFGIIQHATPSFVVQATSEPNSNEPNSSFSSALQDDLKYLLKLAIGSVLGAALIKYGSAAVPDITRPDITQALLMISTPPVVAVLLLAKESRKN